MSNPNRPQRRHIVAAIVGSILIVSCGRAFSPNHADVPPRPDCPTEDMVLVTLAEPAYDLPAGAMACVHHEALRRVG